MYTSYIMSLSFTKGKKIARIEGGKFHGKIIRINNELPKAEESDGDTESSDDELLEDINVHNYVSEKDIKQTKGKYGNSKPLKISEVRTVIEALKNKKKPTDKRLKKVYNKQMEKINDMIKKNIKLEDGKFIPLPNDDINMGERVYLSAPSGSGKSTWASNYIKEYLRMFPKNQFVIFSNVKEDAPLDALNPIRIPLHDTEFVNDMIEDRITADELKDKVVLFDDVDVLADKKLRETIQNLRDQMLMEGRHVHAYTICCSHKIANHKSTKMLLEEANRVVFFPRMGSAHGIKYFLKEYCGLDTKKIQTIMDSPSRWVCIGRMAPQYILTETEMYLIADMDK